MNNEVTQQLIAATAQSPIFSVCVIAFASIFVAGMAVYAAIMVIKCKSGDE